MIYYKDMPGGDEIVTRVHHGEYMPLFVCSSIVLVHAYRVPLSVRINDTLTQLAVGETALVLPGNVQSYTPIEEGDYLTVSIPSIYAAHFVEHYSALCPDSPIVDNINLLSILEYIDSNRDNMYAIMSAIHHIAGKYVHHTFTPISEKLRSFMVGAVAVIDANYTIDLTIDQLAKALGYATHYVSGLIGKTFGSTFSGLLNERRIVEATKLLHDTDMSIGDISTRCGYSSIRSFNRNFSLINKMTPSEFRDSL